MVMVVEGPAGTQPRRTGPVRGPSLQGSRGGAVGARHAQAQRHHGPVLTQQDGAAKSVIGWPGYRMTGGFMLTKQWRMNDCFRHQRFPEPKYLSDSITAIMSYQAVNANGIVYGGPGIKR